MGPDTQDPRPFARYRVIELADMKGDFGAKLLGDLGADVIKVEPPDGSPVRRLAPFAADQPDPERSLLFLSRNTNKRGVTLDLSRAEGRDLFRRLIATADVFIESNRPGYLAELDATR